MTFPIALSGRSRLVLTRTKAVGSPARTTRPGAAAQTLSAEVSLSQAQTSDGFLALLGIQSESEYHLAIEREEVWARATTWTNLRTLCAVNKPQRRPHSA